LIVEDETMIALSLEADMRELGFDTCDLAADGQEAFSHATSNQPDVVLMDVNLEGGREGIEAAKRLREACDVPIVFVTGCHDRDTVARIHKVVPGAPVLGKPVWSDRLSNAVAAVTGFRMWWRLASGVTLRRAANAVRKQWFCSDCWQFVRNARQSLLGTNRQPKAVAWLLLIGSLRRSFLKGIPAVHHVHSSDRASHTDVLRHSATLAVYEVLQAAMLSPRIREYYLE